jgi:Holliday junction DNA helicase RuvB
MKEETTKRITAPDRLPEELEFDQTVRPTTLEEFVGQEKLKEKLGIAMAATKARGEALDHILFYGPPGLGKTTLATIMAHELGVGIKTTSGPVLERPYDLVGPLSNLEPREVLFIDEVHRTNHVVEEYLYSAMEDFKIDIMVDKGPAARSVKLTLNPFTLIGATTRAGLLSSPMRARFGITERLDYYPAEDLYKIVLRSSRILGVEVNPEGAMEIAKRSRGTPRVANRLLRRVRDFAQIKTGGKIDKDTAQKALAMWEVDEIGLDEMDKRVLDTIISKFQGGPVGLNTYAVAVGEEAETLEEVYEPFLIQQGFLKRTPRGREATERAYKHFGIAWDGQGKLL